MGGDFELAAGDLEIVRAFVEQHNAEQIELCGWCEFVDKKKNEKRVICLGQYRIWLLKPPAKGKKAEVAFETALLNISGIRSDSAEDVRLDPFPLNVPSNS